MSRFIPPAPPRVDDQPFEQVWSSGLSRAHGGVPEVSVEWALAHRDDVRLVDVREPVELVSELGAIPGAENVPMGALGQIARDWDPAAPLVLVCRSGARSGHAALALERSGFRRVASVAGGMLALRRTPTADAALPRGRSAGAPRED